MTDLERRLSRSTTPAVDPARVTAELARRADAEGLLDVAWATLDTPLGPIAVFVSRRGLVRRGLRPRELRPGGRRGGRARVAPGPGGPAAHRSGPRAARTSTSGSGAARSTCHRLDPGPRLQPGACCGPPPRSRSGRRRATAGRGGRRRLAAAARAAGNALAGNPIPIVVPVTGSSTPMAVSVAIPAALRTSVSCSASKASRLGESSLVTAGPRSAVRPSPGLVVPRRPPACAIRRLCPRVHRLLNNHRRLRPRRTLQRRRLERSVPSMAFAACTSVGRGPAGWRCSGGSRSAARRGRRRAADAAARCRPWPTGWRR